MARRSCQASAQSPSEAHADDTVLIELGRQWQAVRDGFTRKPASDEYFEALCVQEDALLDAIVATPARTLEGLAVKARVLAIEHECDGYDEASILKALEDAWYPKKPAFSLAADILRLSKEG